MTRKQVKIGQKVAFCDFPEDVGEIRSFDSLGIDVYYDGKSILWNPCTISWLDLKLYNVVIDKKNP